MWFKKKSVLLAEHHYDTEKSADASTDLRTRPDTYSNYSSSISSGLPSAADAGNYFYLPALGYYKDGQQYSVGGMGFYWSSTAYPQSSDNAYDLNFGGGSVSVDFYFRYNGFRVDGKFE